MTSSGLSLGSFAVAHSSVSGRELERQTVEWEKDGGQWLNVLRGVQVILTCKLPSREEGDNAASREVYLHSLVHPRGAQSSSEQPPLN